MPFDSVSFFIPIILALVVNLLFWLFYRHRKKKDRGFVLPYYRLSYRRRFKRNLWTLPLIIVSIIVILLLDYLPIVIRTGYGLVISVATVIELIYNYKKANKEKEDR
jgi:heme/copper-type cytochrome/quinol oxidase subunit 2